MKLPPLLCKLLCTMSHIAPQLSQRGRTLPQGNQKGEVVTSRAKQGCHVRHACYAGGVCIVFAVPFASLVLFVPASGEYY